MDPETRAVLEAVQTFKKKAPRLNRNDRTLSLAVDNYLPPGAQQHSSINVASGVTIDPNLLIDNNLMIPPSSHSHVVSSPIQEFRKPNIFYMEGSNHSLNNYSDFTHPHTHQMSRKPNIRRSDTLDVYGAYEMRKANSFNSNDMASDEMLLSSRRTNSMRHTQQGSNYPYEMDDIGSLPPPAPPIVTETGNTRRNCRMHKSFHDRSRQHEIKMEKIADAVKCQSLSLGDDGSDDNVIVGNKRRLSPKFNSAESSLDNEVFHSRSGSRSKIESASIEAMDAIESATSPTSLLATKKSTVTTAHKHSSQSLDKSHHSFRRIARATQSFYLNPVQAEELRLQRAMHSTTNMTTAKRLHSASMRAKPFGAFRDVLAETKKSKSFVTDPFVGGGPADYELSPRRRESITDIKKSPRLSTSTYDQKSSNYDGNDMDYDTVMHAYRQNRRKSSILSSGGGGLGGTGSKKKGSSKKKTAEGNEAGISDTDAEDGDTESTRKRKRIVCILVSLFLSLVFAGVFVVVFTFTYSSMTQVSDHTKRVYTFAPGPGNRDMPIHHHNGKYFRKFLRLCNDVPNIKYMDVLCKITAKSRTVVHHSSDKM